MFAKLHSTIANFVEHQCTQMAAAIAYYMVFSLPGLLLISVTVAGYIAGSGALGDESDARKEIYAMVDEAVGPIGAEQVDELIRSSRHHPPSPLHAVAGTALLLLSASAVVIQVQNSLNTILHVEPDSGLARDRGFLRKRFISFLAVVAMGVLLVVSVAISMLLSTLGEMLTHVLPDPLLQTPQLVGEATGLVGTFLLFTAIYRWLPDTRVSWRFALVGGVLTAMLFTVGKTLLAFYLAKVHIGSAYGVAGSLAMLLVWFYYSALVFLLAAEFTYVLRSGTR